MDYLLFFAAFISLMAYLQNEEEEPGTDEVHLYYYRNDADFHDWRIWIWNIDSASSGQSIEAELVEPNRFRARYRIPLGNIGNIGILPYRDGWKDKDGPDRLLNNTNNKARGQRIYLVEGEPDLRTTKPVIQPPLKNAFLDSQNSIQIQFPCAINQESSEKILKMVKLERPNGKKVPIKEVHLSENHLEAILILQKNLGINDKELCKYEVHVKGFKKVFLQPRGILFQQEINYSEEMGLTVDEQLTFRCFAPTAREVSAMIFNDAGCINDETDPSHIIPMTEIRPGLWEVTTAKQDKMGKYYSYLVSGSDYGQMQKREAIDPYAKLVLNRRGRAKIFEDQTTVSPSPKFDKTETVIYELHLRDFSADPKGGVDPKGKYAGLGAVGCRHLDHNNLSTGLDHLKELGINTIQILPTHFFDVDPQSDAYDWGYMPVHYFSSYPGYAENIHATVAEFKQLISNLHNEGFKVVIDVVLNHTAENLDDAINFHALAPGYYYRRTHDGSYFNGSGCGNEFKTEAPMARKFVLDYLKYWTQEFKIDGFRFDLMGLMDYETFRLIDDELSRINPDILLYGEPWAADNAGVSILGKGCQRETRFAVFNDHYRDALRGDNSSNGKGFIQGKGERLKIAQGFCGSIHEFCHHPTETINYVACHDNYTLRDKLELSSGISSERELQKMERMSALLLLTSQGIPFLHNGQEFGRSKQHNHNSYNASDEINQIVWEDKKKRKKLFEYHKKLIRLRMQHRIFRMSERSLIENNFEWVQKWYDTTVPDEVAMFLIRSEGFIDSFEEVLIIANTSKVMFKANCPQGNWRVAVRGAEVWTKISNMPSIDSNILKVPGRDCLMIAKINQ